MNQLKIYYGSINVRTTLAMKQDKYRRETCGSTASSCEWMMCIRISSTTTGSSGVTGIKSDGQYGGMWRRTVSGEEDKKEHGGAIFLIESITSGEFEVQQLQYVNTRCMWKICYYYIITLLHSRKGRRRISKKSITENKYGLRKGSLIRKKERTRTAEQRAIGDRTYGCFRNGYERNHSK